uniref:Uncharacterized protein n=1 Tax=Anopheles maculatus TaxID=74869 RepID=A0A182S8K4_9DIPT
MLVENSNIFILDDSNIVAPLNGSDLLLSEDEPARGRITPSTVLAEGSLSVINPTYLLGADVSTAGTAVSCTTVNRLEHGPSRPCNIIAPPAGHHDGVYDVLRKETCHTAVTSGHTFHFNTAIVSLAGEASDAGVHDGATRVECINGEFLINDDDYYPYNDIAGPQRKEMPRVAVGSPRESYTAKKVDVCIRTYVIDTQPGTKRKDIDLDYVNAD